MKYQHILFCAGLALAIASCKKTDTAPATTAPGSGTGTSTAYTANDSALAYARDIYLWYNQIPSTFDPKPYSDLDTLMRAIRKYSVVTGYANPVDHFSFATLKSTYDNQSAGVAQDFGLSVFFLAGTKNLYVKYVQRDAPAGKAGILRGWQVTALNGNAIDTTTAGINDIINSVFYSTSTKFSLKKPDGTSTDITLSASTYQSHPFLADSVYRIGSTIIGYFAYNTFQGDSLETDQQMKRIFSRFDASGVNDVIVDLRYNGGGFAYNAIKLSNYLAPLSANGQTMMTQQYNDKYTQYNITSRFTKTNSLNLSRIVFITGTGTASASELVINNMLPFMTVKLTGPATATYGKPVGFFPITVGNYYIFPVSLKVVNNAGNSDYYFGFKVDKPVNDGVDKNWGDLSESCLASAVKYLTTGAFRTSAEQPYQPSAGTPRFGAEGFQGAVFPNPGIRR